MKKFFYILLLFFSPFLYAQKTVNIVWPFSASSSQSNMIRAVIDNANTQQNKYQFIFLHKPGAGGTIAANHVLESKDIIILASTSSFYIRPNLFKDSYNVDQFELIGHLCESQPLAIFSKKIQSITETKDRSITLGVIPGSITTLVTRAIMKENPNIKITEIPYKGTPEATTDMLGGHIDGSVDFIGNPTIARLGKEVNILGITGNRVINGYPTFVSLKINGLENATNDYFIFVSKNADNQIKQELMQIFQNSIDQKIKTFCEDDFGQIPKKNALSFDKLHKINKEKWYKLTSGIAKE